MPNITDQMIAQYQHPRIKLVIGGTTIYEDDIVSGSFSYRGGTTGGGAFAPGGCVISSASFSVYNRTGSYTNTFAEGTEVQIYIGYGATPSTATYDLLCTVYVADATKRNYKIAVSCYDKLRDADKEKWTTYSFPMTVRQIISSAATEAGITVNTLPATNAGGSISVDLRDDEGNQPDLSMTCRQAIAQALLISGHFGYMTPSGQLYCGWYGSSVDKTIQTSWIFDYNVSDAQDYTGVQVYGQTPSGTTTRLYVLSSGRFITEDNCAAIQSRLYTALVGMAIRKGTFSMVCNPNVRPGQIVQVTVPMAGSNVTMTIPLTSVVIKGSLKATYSAEAVSADTQDDLRKGQEDYATKEDVAKAIAEAGGGGCSVVHFPRVVINDKNDPYGDLPFTRAMGFITLAPNYGTPHSDYASDGKYVEVEWADCVCVIPPFYPNNDVHFDVTLYLRRLYGHVYGVGSQGDGWFDWIADDSSHPNDEYAVAVHAKAHYGNTPTSILFDSVWLDFNGNCDNVGLIAPSMQVPLPGRTFNLSTGHWSSLIVSSESRYIDYPDETPSTP